MLTFGLRRSEGRVCPDQNGAGMSEGSTDFIVWVCEVCGLEYNEAEGWPDEGIAPGTRWADIPEDWECPDCGASKGEFEMREVTK